MIEKMEACPQCGEHAGGWVYDFQRCKACGFDRMGYATEPTDQGLQYVIPGCEKDRTRGPKQGDLF